MKEKNNISSDFSMQSMIAAALPSYIFPALMSFLSGYFLPENRAYGSKLLNYRSVFITIDNIKFYHIMAIQIEKNFSAKQIDKIFFNHIINDDFGAHSILHR